MNKDSRQTMRTAEKLPVEKLISFPASIRAYVELVRPFTLLSPVVVAISGSFMSTLYHGQQNRFFESWEAIIRATMSLALVQMCGQALNQAEDPVELDILNNKSYRPLPQGKISPRQARISGLLTGFLALVLSLTVNLSFGLGISLLLFFAVFYSVEPLRVKRRRVIGTLWLGLSRGLMPLPVVWSVLYSPFETLPLILGLMLFFWVSGFQITKDFPDMKGDRVFDLPTFPVKYGVVRTKRFMHLMNVFAFLILAVCILTQILVPSFALAFLLFPVGMVVINRISEKPKAIKGIENSAEWAFFYIGLGIFYILFTLAMVMA